jgi:hypothetical protein
MENISEAPQIVKDCEWIGFPGGELEGRRPKVLCPACREDIARVLGTRRGSNDGGSTWPGDQRGRTICFQCYRAEIDRDHALKAAGELDTASEARFQTALPFEPVNRPRLQMLKAEHSAARAFHKGVARFEDRRRQAQIAARHALQQIAAGVVGADGGKMTANADDRAREIAYAIHAAELQLPESWIPFVVSR